MTIGPDCDNPACAQKLQAASDEIAGLNWTTRNQARKIGDLERQRRDDGQRLRQSGEWKRCERLFKFWQRETGHTRSPFTLARFKQAKPFLSDYEDEMLMRAITGLAHDPYITPNANGTQERHDWWHNLFNSQKSDNIERYANKAPLTWRETLAEHQAEVEAQL